MEAAFAVIKKQEGHLYERPGEETGRNTSELTDVLLSGWAVEILLREPYWLYVRTFYGYKGWIFREELQEITKSCLESRQDPVRFCRIGARSADLLAEPKVQGTILETLLRDSIVSKAGPDGAEAPAGNKKEKSPEGAAETAPEGWTRIRSASGAAGWVFSSQLAPRLDDDQFLLRQDPFWFLKKADLVRKSEKEEVLRERAAASALSYQGTSYRWGGKSPLGIDCSGLVFMSWLEQGILIYRDASIKAADPVREIQREQLRKGDLIFFPGHVAMSLGGDRFIHATGHPSSPCVRINSLSPSDPGYRADLAGRVTRCGSLFGA